MFRHIQSFLFEREMTTWPFLGSSLLLVGLKMQLDDWVCNADRFHVWGPIPHTFFSEGFQLVELGYTLPLLFGVLCLAAARARHLGLPKWVLLLVLVPLFNLFFLLLLGFTNHKERATGGRELRFFVPSSIYGSISLAVLLSGSFGLMLIYYFKNYGLTLFFVIPFLGGLLAVLFHSGKHVLNERLVLKLATGVCFSMGFLMLAFALEGMLCLTMAALPALFLSGLGGFLGLALLRGSASRRGSGMAIVLFLPISTVFDIKMEAPLLPVTTEVVIEATAQEVWDTFIEFPPIPEPTEFLFRNGISYPTHATIEGEGIGAVRYCHFSTGPFVEPITIWEEPFLLGFSVTSQPLPMQELSPHGEIHPPHLDGYLRSERGELRIIPIDEHRVVLRGTTWYRQDLAPQWYWRAWSDYIIGRIHERVLGHVRDVAEQGGAL